ncbi:MAG TPA: hypothetical protein VJN21_14185 [Candidatus Acidoferrales bacterium]|nr:hypothetical protein [Candidatus Acidoferrales bacterium]
MIAAAVAMHAIRFSPHFSFPQGAAANEEIVLRWIHFVSGIMWIGLLYFFNLVGGPAMKELDPASRGKIYPPLMSRAMGVFRWSAVVAVLVGLRYYAILLQADAQNAGQPRLLGRWFGEWFLVWLIAYVFLYALQMPFGGPLGNGWVRAALIAIVVIAASWIVLDWNAGPESSNAHLAISVGGGLGLVMLLNVWGIVWRVQKRLIAWNREFAEHGTPIPEKAAKMMQFSSIASRTAFWLSFPMLFFMAAAEHYPFLGSIGR